MLAFGGELRDNTFTLSFCPIDVNLFFYSIVINDSVTI